MSRQIRHHSKHSLSNRVTEEKGTIHLEDMPKAQGIPQIMNWEYFFGEVEMVGWGWSNISHAFGRGSGDWIDCTWRDQVGALKARDGHGNAGNRTLEDLGVGLKGFTTKTLPANTGQSQVCSPFCAPGNLLCSLKVP